MTYNTMIEVVPAKDPEQRRAGAQEFCRRRRSTCNNKNKPLTV